MTRSPALGTFRYRAFASDGRVVTSTLTASSREDAIASLYAQGLTPFETWASVVAEKTPTAAARWWPGRGSDVRSRGPRLSAKTLQAFTFELAALLRAGLALDAAMRNMSGAGSKADISRLARELLRNLLEGAQLSEAMARYPAVFAADYRAIVGAGEAAGSLPRMLDDLAALLARRLEIRAKLLAALVYPAILLAMSLASLGVIVAVLVPNIAPIFTDAGLPLPSILGALVAARDEAPWLAAGGGATALGCAALAGATGRNPGWRAILDRALIRLPVVGRFISERNAGRFMRGLSTLVDAGVPLMAALRIALGLVANHDLARRYRGAIARVPEGISLNRVLDDEKLIPGPALRLIALGEGTGRLGTMLAQAAALVEGEQQRGVDRMLSLLTPIITLVVGGGVGALIMSVMGAVLSINDLAFR